jgi:hypothetical protein
MTFQAACYLALLGRLWFTGLAARYKFLCCYLVLEILGTGGLAWLSIRSWTYAIAYFCITPILWILGYLVVLELCWLILEDYPGIAGAGRRIVTVTMGIAVLLAFGVGAYGLIVHKGDIPFLRSFSIVHMSVRVGLLVFLLVIQYFVFLFRLTLPRNRKIYGIGYAVCWTLALAADAVSMNVGVHLSSRIDSTEMLICSGLLIAGAIMLKPEGELRQAVAEPETDEKRAIVRQKLTEMNEVLMGVGKRIKKKNGG